jgi:hypothetical protein
VKTKELIVLICWLTPVVFIFGCSPEPFIPFKWIYKEVKRIGSPDSKVEAVIITGDAGATTSEETFVAIVRTGQKIDTNSVDRSETVFAGDLLKEFGVSWKEDHLLIIKYDQARIDGYKNHYHVYGDAKETYPVEIRLEPTSLDFSLPAEERQPVQIK